MKKQTALRILPVSLMLSVAALAVLPSLIMAADRSIQLWPPETQVGATVQVRAEGFGADYPAVSVRSGFPFVTVYFSSEEAGVGDVISDALQHYEIVDPSELVDEFGNFTTSFAVPDWLTMGATEHQKVQIGANYVYVTYKGDDHIVAMRQFNVTNRPPAWFRIRLSPYRPGGFCSSYWDGNPCDECAVPDNNHCSTFPWSSPADG